jgi:arsenite methyltransferase
MWPAVIGALNCVAIQPLQHGRLAVMVPTTGWAARFWRMLPNIGAHLFGEDEIGDILEDHGFTSVRTNNFGTLQWVRGKRG